MDTNLVVPLGPRLCNVIFDYFLDASLKVTNSTWNHFHIYMPLVVHFITTYSDRMMKPLWLRVWKTVSEFRYRLLTVSVMYVCAHTI